MKSSKERFANLVDGFSSVFATIGSRRDYIAPDRSGFVRDAQNISDDYRVVAANMRRAVADVENKYKVR